MKRISSQLSTLAIALAIGACSGCYSCWDHFDAVTMDVRDHFAAKRAWSKAGDCYAEHEYRSDFGRGFRQGYEDVAAGQNGCPPAVPPRNYWGVKYQSPEGRARIEAWFEGYSHGALAATQDGVAEWNTLVVKQPDSCFDTNTHAEYLEPQPEGHLPMPEMAPPAASDPTPPLTRVPDLFVPEILPPVEFDSETPIAPNPPGVDSSRREPRAAPMPVAPESDAFPADAPTAGPLAAEVSGSGQAVQPVRMQSIKSKLNRDGTLVHERTAPAGWRPTIDIRPRVTP